MAKKRGYRSEVEVVDEAISVEVEPELEEVFEEPATCEETEKVQPVYTIKEAATVIAFRLNVRENPDLDSNIVKVLNFKDDIEIIDEDAPKGWSLILTNDGIKGYCLSKFIRAIK